MSTVLTGPIRRGSTCQVRVNGKCVPGEVLDVRDRVIWMKCPPEGIPADGTGLVLEFQDGRSISGYYARVLTASPDTLSEMVLLRSSSLHRDELRTSLRVPSQIPVRVDFEGPKETIEGNLVNISAGGAYVESMHSPNFDGDPRVLLYMADEPALHVTGCVVHTEGEHERNLHRFGVRFTDVRAEDTRAITWYVWSRVRAIFPESD